MNVSLIATLGASLITGAVTLVVCLVNNHYQNNATRQLIEYRLIQLENKVDKHNTVIERTFKLEERCALVENDIKVANHRITDLEETEKN